MNFARYSAVLFLILVVILLGELFTHTFPGSNVRVGAAVSGHLAVVAGLDPIRDIFLFCCFSGLRHSDVNNLRRSDIKGDHIEVTTVKTADSISIELNKVTRDILEKYKDTPFKDNKALPNYTNQAMNRDIKELCKLASIDEEIRVTTYKGNVRTDKIQPKWELVGTHTAAPSSSMPSPSASPRTS